MRLGFMLLVLFPITELMILLKVGGLIGVLPTLALILLTASAGLYLMRREGFSTFVRAQQRMASGEVPATEIMEGLMIAFCGALLLAPGFMTDIIALCGLIPPVRRLIIKCMTKSSRFQGYTSGGSQSSHYSRHQSAYSSAGNDTGRTSSGDSPWSGAGRRRPSSEDVIDGEYRRED